MSRLEARLAAVVRLLTGAVFFAAGYGKVTGQFVRGSFASSASDMVKRAWPFWAAFLRSVVLAHPAIFAWIVAISEVAIGLGLLLGLWTRVAAAAGALLVLCILLGQSYLPGSSWDGWLTAGITSKFAILLLVLLATITSGMTWGLDARIARRRRRLR